mmetsp:Transcript_976/g.1387  ORF Transcript_976/g.1387 Transcript_976/m.1387 type:complete len:247 (+) Transcript_976:1623-2363(+)
MRFLVGLVIAKPSGIYLLERTKVPLWMKKLMWYPKHPVKLQRIKILLVQLKTVFLSCQVRRSISQKVTRSRRTINLQLQPLVSSKMLKVTPLVVLSELIAQLVTLRHLLNLILCKIMEVRYLGTRKVKQLHSEVTSMKRAKVEEMRIFLVFPVALVPKKNLREAHSLHQVPISSVLILRLTNQKSQKRTKATLLEHLVPNQPSQKIRIFLGEQVSQAILKNQILLQLKGGVEVEYLEAQMAHQSKR